MTETWQSQNDQNSTISQVINKIQEYLSSVSPIYAINELTAETPLLKGGALDSLGILNLTIFLSSTMNIEIVDEDFVPENFNTVGDLAELIIRKS